MAKRRREEVSGKGERTDELEDEKVDVQMKEQSHLKGHRLSLIFLLK